MRPRTDLPRTDQSSTGQPRIDLHCHSTASDGTTTPTELVQAALAAALDVVAITDHDTTAGWDEAAAALPSGLSLVRGVELSCTSGPEDDRTSLHLLAYLVDPAHPQLVAEMAALREARLGRAEAIVGLLAADGHAVTWERVQQLADGGTVGRPHIARALVETGAVPDVAAAFTREWVADGGRYHLPKRELPVLDAVRLVRAAGGVPVFAHPGAAARGRTVSDDVVVAMAEAGLAGLEVDHLDHDAAARAHYRGLAAELGLLTTGSSDFHGTSKDVALGSELTDPAVLEAIVAGATGSPVVTG